MKLISLSQGLHAKVDDDDYDSLIRFKWTAVKTSGSRIYALRKIGTQNLYMHHFILGETLPGHEVDHINGDGLDNQRSNLRLLTHQQNLMNRGPQKNNTSGYKGVTFRTFDRSPKKWQAQLRVNKKTVHLGCFLCPHEAAERYNRAAKQYFGDLAYQNVIPPKEMRVQAEEMEDEGEE